MHFSFSAVNENDDENEISGFDISVTYLGQHDPNSNGYQTKTTMANCGTLDDFGWCKVDVLRAYLKDRGLQHSRFQKKEELVALAFAAYCQDLPVTGISQIKSNQIKFIRDIK